MEGLIYVKIFPVGRMAERFKAPVLKTGVANNHREFESHSFRQSIFCVIILAMAP